MPEKAPPGQLPRSVEVPVLGTWPSGRRLTFRALCCRHMIAADLRNSHLMLGDAGSRPRRWVQAGRSAAGGAAWLGIRIFLL